MRPVHQTEFGNEKGNCYQACIASIFELELSEVPNFCVTTRLNWFEAVQLWLYEYDLCLIHIEPCTFPWVKGMYHIMSGKSPRGDWMHSVVGCDGEMEFDPHPSGDGLAKVEVFELFVKLTARRRPVRC